MDEAVENLKEQIDDLITYRLINLKSSDKDVFEEYTRAYFFELEDNGFKAEDADKLATMLETAFKQYKEENK